MGQTRFIPLCVPHCGVSNVHEETRTTAIKQEVDALNTISSQMDNVCKNSNYNDMYIDFLETLKLWQEMEDF